MPDMTLTEAAKWTGKTRATVHKAIKSGRLSATLNENREYRINPAELERVYKAARAVDVSVDGKKSSSDTPDLMAAKQAEIDLLREWLADARTERDKATAALAEATTTIKLLSHQPTVTMEPRKWWRLWQVLPASGH